MRSHLADVLAAVRALEGMADPLEALGGLRRLDSEIETAMHGLVELARESGASWTDIGEQLDTTRQAAHQRFRR